MGLVLVIPKEDEEAAKYRKKQKFVSRLQEFLAEARKELKHQYE